MKTPKRWGASSPAARTIGKAAAMLLVLDCTWCVTSPRSHTGVDTGADGSTVTFTGVVAGSRGQTVVVQVRDPNGNWVSVGSAPVPPNGQWSVAAHVPGADWSVPCGVAVFQAVLDRAGGAQNVPLTGLDGPCAAAVGPLPAPGADPTAYDNALAACATTTFVVHKDGAPVTGAVFDGNLSIVGQSQADLYACVSTVNGNLALAGDDSLAGAVPAVPSLTLVGGANAHLQNALSLPNLMTVTGDTTVTLANIEVADPQHQQVDWVTNALDTPRLASIGATLTLVTQSRPLNGGEDPIQNLEYSFGLGGLTTVQNLVFDQPFENRHPGGLGALTAIPGNVDITWEMGEVHLGQSGAYGDGEDFLTSLTSIGGHFNFTIRGGNLNQLFPRLGTVAGDLTLSAGGTYQPLGGSILGALTQVGGVFTLNADFCGGPQFAQLAQIGGLTLSGRSFGSPIGTTPLRIGSSGIIFDGTANSGFPFATTPNITATAPVTMTNNASLCVCQVTSFEQALQAQGWSGLFAGAGNGTASTCPSAPASGPPLLCPAPACGSPGGGAPPG